MRASWSTAANLARPASWARATVVLVALSVVAQAVIIERARGSDDLGVPPVLPTTSCLAGWLVYHRDTSSGTSLFARCADAQSAEVSLVSGGRNVDPAIAPDGVRLAYAHNDGVWQVYQLNLLTGNDTKLSTFAGNNGEVPTAWSADGTRLFTSSTNGDSYYDWDEWAMNVTTGAEVRLTSTGQTHGWSTGGGSPSIDGRYVFVHVQVGEVNDFDLYRAASDGSGATAITNVSAQGGVAMDPRVSPDGLRLAYAGGVAGATTVRIEDFLTGKTSDTTIPVGWPSGCCPDPVAWSPDGASLAVESVAGEISIWNLATGASVRVASGHGVVWVPCLLTCTTTHYQDSGARRPGAGAVAAPPSSAQSQQTDTFENNRTSPGEAPTTGPPAWTVAPTAATSASVLATHLPPATERAPDAPGSKPLSGKGKHALDVLSTNRGLVDRAGGIASNSGDLKSKVDDAISVVSSVVGVKRSLKSESAMGYSAWDAATLASPGLGDLMSKMEATESALSAASRTLGALQGAARGVHNDATSFIAAPDDAKFATLKNSFEAAIPVYNDAANTLDPVAAKLDDAANLADSVASALHGAADKSIVGSYIATAGDHVGSAARGLRGAASDIRHGAETYRNDAATMRSVITMPRNAPGWNWAVPAALAIGVVILGRRPPWHGALRGRGMWGSW